MAKWEVKYILPEYGTKYFYGEIEADSQVEAARLFKAMVPKCKIIGGAKHLWDTFFSHLSDVVLFLLTMKVTYEM